MSNIVTTLRNIFRIEELRTRIIFTLVVLLAVRIGSFITVPGVDVDLLRSSSSLGDSGTIFGLYDMFVGGAFSNAALFALGIMPYISASIILQIAGVVLPSLQKMQREGEDGRRKINQYTRYLTVFVALLQAYGVTLKIAQTTAGPGGLSVVPDAGFFWTASSVIILTAGTIVLMWLGEQITDRYLAHHLHRYHRTLPNGNPAGDLADLRRFEKHRRRHRPRRPSRRYHRRGHSRHARGAPDSGPVRQACRRP